MKTDTDRLTEFQKCRERSDNDLLDYISKDPRFRLWPAVQVLLERRELLAQGNNHIYTANVE